MPHRNLEEVKSSNRHQESHLVTLERTDPVASGAVAQHGQAILAGAREKVAIWCDRAA